MQIDLNDKDNSRSLPQPGYHLQHHSEKGKRRGQSMALSYGNMQNVFPTTSIPTIMIYAVPYAKVVLQFSITIPEKSYATFVEWSFMIIWSLLNLNGEPFQIVG